MSLCRKVDNLRSDGKELLFDFSFEFFEACLAHTVKHRQRTALGHITVDHLKVAHRNEQGIFILVHDGNKLRCRSQHFALFNALEDSHTVVFMHHIVTGLEFIQNDTRFFDLFTLERFIQRKDQFVGAKQIGDAVLIDKGDILKAVQLRSAYNTFVSCQYGDLLIFVRFKQLVGICYFKITVACCFRYGRQQKRLSLYQWGVQLVNFIQFLIKISAKHSFGSIKRILSQPFEVP